jgi:RNA polymerase sigma factor (sigma-70 family)
VTDELDAILPRLQADPEAHAGWSALHGTLWTYLVTVAHRILGPDHGAMAPDVVQDVFTRFSRAPLFSRFSNGASLRAYLAKATRNRAYDVLRSTHLLEPLDEVEELFALAQQAEVEERLQADELLLAIRKGLKPADRDLLDRLLLGHSTQEIAADLGLDYVAARVRIHRLRKRIDGQLHQMG